MADVFDGLSERSWARPGHTRSCVDGELVQAAYTAIRLKRAPRGFLVFGPRESFVWPVLALLAWIAIVVATAQQEREAEHERAELRDRVDIATAALDRCLDEELTCEGVLTTCVRVVGDGLGCSCFIPEDITP